MPVIHYSLLSLASMNYVEFRAHGFTDEGLGDSFQKRAIGGGIQMLVEHLTFEVT